jgi:hypothetical protein
MFILLMLHLVDSLVDYWRIYDLKTILKIIVLQILDWKYEM